MAIGVGRLRPIDGRYLAAVAGIAGRLDELGAADFLVTLGTQSGDDQLAVIVIDKEAIAVPHDERGGPAGLLAGDRQRLPNALARGRAEAAELAVAADSVNVVAIEDGGRDQRMKAVGIDLAVALSLPD